jgi:hypothetical protein
MMFEAVWSQVKVDVYNKLHSTYMIANCNGMCMMLCKFKLLLTSNVSCNEIT